MKVIIPSGTINIAASSEYGNFAASRLINQNLGQVWQGETYQETLTISAPPGGDSLGLFGTNALSIEVLSIAGYIGREWAGASAGPLWANNRAWAPGASEDYMVGLDIYTYLGPTTNSYWLEWPLSTSSVDIQLRLTGPSAGRVYAGIVSAGKRTDLPNPQYGLGESFKEFSIHHDNALGPSYYSLVQMAREFRWKILVGRDREFYSLMNDIIYKYGSQPFAWRITEIANDSTDPDRMVWAAPFQKTPTGSHDFPANSIIQGYLREFL